MNDPAPGARDVFETTLSSQSPRSAQPRRSGLNGVGFRFRASCRGPAGGLWVPSLNVKSEVSGVPTGG